MDEFHSNARWENEVADVGRRSRGSAARTIVGEGRGSSSRGGPQAMLQKVISTVIQETPFRTAGDKCFCCVLGLSDQA